MAQDIFRKILNQAQNSKDILLLNNNYTYGEFYEQTQIYSSFLKNNFKKNNILAICMNYSEKLILLIFACYLNKIKFTIINPNSSEKEKKSVIKDCKANGIFFDNNLIKVNKYHNFKNINFSKISEKINKKIINKDLCLIYTSGTSGVSKGVILTINSLSNNVLAISKNLKIKKKDKGIIFSPPGYAMAISQILLFMSKKSSIFLQPTGMRFPFEILKAILKYKISVLNISVSAYNVFKKIIKNKKIPHVRLVMSGGMEMRFKTYNEYKINFPKARFINFYGCTENSPRVAHYQIKEKISSKFKINYFPVGKALNGVKIKIKKKNLLEKSGLIFISGTSLMRCYINDKYKKKYTWYNTGDLGHFDENKNLVLVGRNDNIFRVGHEKLSPEEIEIVLKKKFNLNNPIVSKISDPILGFKPILVLEKKEKKISNKKLISELVKFFSSYKIPKQIFYIDAIPKNHYGKVDRKKVSIFIN